jgi:AcrR family transcriptional regulator
MSAVGADPTIRRQVVAAARQVIADDERAPIARIAREAGVSRATFYRHFGSRRALLASIDRDAPPGARERILDAAQEMLQGSSLADLSMEDLARAAGVSRGTLYRLFPGKAALLHGLIDAYSPFERVSAVLAEHADEPPNVVLPLVARAVAGAAGRRPGLARAVLHESTSPSPTTLAGVRPALQPVLGALAEYLGRQMAAGRMRRMDPILAIQAVLGPIYFHLMTRPMIGQILAPPMDLEAAMDELTQATLAGLDNGGRAEG